MIVSEHKHSLHFMVMTMSLEQTRALSQSFSWPGEVHSAKQRCCLRNLASTQARSRSLGGLKLHLISGTLLVKKHELL